LMSGLHGRQTLWARLVSGRGGSWELEVVEI
jgi:hypothetical protein